MYNLKEESIIKNAEISSISLDEFLNNLQVKIINRSNLVLELDIINCHSSIANAIRRILISEIPTVAIHDLLIRDNDTIFPDEYIGHRLGLIPINIDPELLEFKNGKSTYKNTLHFKLDCKNETNDIICVYSESIVWIPSENQENFNVSINPEILICKMAPRNSIYIEMYAEKGIGMTHTKWSPVSLCSYKLMNKIVLEKDFFGEDAIKLKKCFSEGVIEIENGKAFVRDARKDTMSREVLRHEEFRNSVKLFRETNWFCFTIESLVLDPMYLFRKAMDILIKKCENIQEQTDTIMIQNK